MGHKNKKLNKKIRRQTKNNLRIIQSLSINGLFSAAMHILSKPSNWKPELQLSGMILVASGRYETFLDDIGQIPSGGEKKIFIKVKPDMLLNQNAKTALNRVNSGLAGIKGFTNKTPRKALGRHSLHLFDGQQLQTLLDNGYGNYINLAQNFDWSNAPLTFDGAFYIFSSTEWIKDVNNNRINNTKECYQYGGQFFPLLGCYKKKF